MVSRLTTIARRQNEHDNDTQINWLSWCRLCAKQESNDRKNSSLFGKNNAGRLDSELATSIGKYFWVNIKPDDGISQCLCFECKHLIEELITFTERVNKVQTLFCLLQNIKPASVEEADQLRTQCGLFDEEWYHIIKDESPNIRELQIPLLNDQGTQTDSVALSDNENEVLSDNQSSIETEEVISILEKHDNDDGFECEIETVTENVYEYVMQSDNEMEFVDNDYMVPSSQENAEGKETITIVEAPADEEDVQDSDLFKELKFKISSNDSEEDKPMETFQIISQEEEVEVECHEPTESLKQEYDEEIEVLEEEDDEDYIDNSGGQLETKTDALGLQKSKRGRPFGTKNSETEASQYRFECKDCKRTYKSPNIFRRHMSSLHNISVDDMPDFIAKANTCPVCSKQFLTRSSLKLHMRHHLPDDEKFNVPCPYCDRRFSQVGAMRQHVNGIHHQMKPFICDQCGRACKTMAALTEHQLVHTNECPFECDVCHKRFKNKPRLKSHMDTHNKSVYKCADCGLELNTKRTLLQHRLVHSDVKRFKCEFCDAAFKRSKAFKNHLILHSGLRPYKCNFCNKSFSNGSNCRAHKKRAHTKELAEEEANGIEPERAPIPRLEELKSVKGILVQPRKIKRHPGGLPHHLRKLLESSEKYKEENGNDCENTVENYESLSDFHYEISKSEIDETESMADNPNEECEETVIYEIIDEI